MRKFGYVQQVVEDFYKSDKDVLTVSLLPRTYANNSSARCAYKNAIKTLGYNIAVRIINGDMYLIRIRYPVWTASHYEGNCYDCAHKYPSKECVTCDFMSNWEQSTKEDNTDAPMA